VTKRKPSNPTPATEGARALLTARETAAAELGLPLDNWMVRQFAVLMVAHDGVEVELATGGGDIDHLLKLTDSMQKLRDSVPKQPLKVQIEFVEGEVCPVCQAHGKERPYHKPPIDNRTGDAPKPAERPSTEVSEPENTTQEGSNGPANANRTSEPLKPAVRPSPKWSGEGDHAFMPAQDNTKGNEDIIKRSPWHGSAALFGVIRGNGKLPGDPDRR
jgi:hypothetical protein